MNTQEDQRPVQTVETSQKFMAWNIKEMSESLKIISMALKNIDSNIAGMMRARQQQRPAAPPPQPKQPSFDDMPPF